MLYTEQILLLALEIITVLETVTVVGLGIPMTVLEMETPEVSDNREIQVALETEIPVVSEIQTLEDSVIQHLKQDLTITISNNLSQDITMVGASDQVIQVALDPVAVSTLAAAALEVVLQAAEAA